jgi:hypothetical protein
MNDPDPEKVRKIREELEEEYRQRRELRRAEEKRTAERITKERLEPLDKKLKRTKARLMERWEMRETGGERIPARPLERLTKTEQEIRKDKSGKSNL